MIPAAPEVGGGGQRGRSSKCCLHSRFKGSSDHTYNTLSKNSENPSLCLIYFICLIRGVFYAEFLVCLPFECDPSQENRCGIPFQCRVNAQNSVHLEGFQNWIFTLGIFNPSHICYNPSHHHKSCLTSVSLCYKTFGVVLHKRAMTGITMHDKPSIWTPTVGHFKSNTAGRFFPRAAIPTLCSRGRQCCALDRCGLLVSSTHCFLFLCLFPDYLSGRKSMREEKTCKWKMNGSSPPYST